MKTHLFFVFGVVAVLALSGCSNVAVIDRPDGLQLSDDSTTIAHVNASCWGVYFFGWPFICGSDTEPGSYTFFEDTTTAERGVAMLTRKAQELGAQRVTDITSRADSRWTSFLIFWVREVHVSGTATR